MSVVDDVRDRLAGSLRALLGGETSEERPAPAVDSLFGPGSAVWDVHADASMLVGGVRSLLLQTLHPPTMAGVADHSDYRHDPLGRLQRTSHFVGITTYGSAADAQIAIDTVRTIHDRITGTAPDGTPYRANDPHLLEWVHSTEVDSFLVAKQRFGHNRLDDQRADTYVAEMAEIARRLGVPEPATSVRELRDTLRRYRPELGLNHQSRAAIRFLAAPPLPLPMRGPYGVLFAGALSTLPNWARRRMWLPRLPVTEALAVRPTTQALTSILDWAMAAGQDRAALTAAQPGSPD
ncbi:MAG: oxygenase MpaB family protein [Acidimicrobiales bacterium]